MFVSGWKVKEFTSEADFHSYLQTATLSVKIYRVLMDELTYEISKITFWSDSQMTLQYIKNETKQFQTYVANCVAEICEVTWWWRGPDFFWETEDCWLIAKYEEVPNSDPEVLDLVSVHPVSVRTHDSDNYTDGCNKTSNTSEDRHGGVRKLIESCGSWPVLQRRVAWIVRFRQWIANGRVACSTKPLTLEELSQSA